MKAIDLFCGAGGMSLGFIDAGFEVVAAIDVEPLNVETHRANLSDVPCWEEDLTAISGRQILKKAGLSGGDITVVFGGPPCQGFSEIGRRDKKDERNALVLRFAQLVCEIRPAYFVMENVRGLLFKPHRALLRRFLKVLTEGGYTVVDPVRALDAADYGVPQRRRRAFFLGYRAGLPAPAYPVPLSGPRPTVRDAIADLPEVEDFPELSDDDEYDGELGMPSSYAATLRAPEGSGSITGCQRTKHTDQVIARFGAAKVGKCEPKSRCYRLDPDAVAFTLRAGTGPDQGSFTAARPIHPWSPRVITVREAARLHSFPDWFEFQTAKWHALRQIGNSVPPRLALAVARAVAVAAREIPTKKTRQQVGKEPSICEMALSATP